MGIITKNAATLLLALFVVCISPSLALVKEVTVSGSSTAMPLVEAAAEEFNIEQRNYAVAVTAGGTGAGIMGIAERKFNIAMASREVTADERQRYGDKFQEFKIGVDGICIAVSDEIYRELYYTPERPASISRRSSTLTPGWSAGRSRRWWLRRSSPP